MTLPVPSGRLLRSRTVADPGVVLADALDRTHTGYVIFERGPDALVTDSDRLVVTIVDGCPRGAAATDGTAGETALALLDATDPVRVEVHAADRTALGAAHDDATIVPPDAPARRLGADDLARRLRDHAPDDRVPDRSSPKPDDGDGDDGTERHEDAAPTAHDSLSAFLDDAERIERLKEQARADARDRAAELGLDAHLED
ncbi:hypothetical protein BRD17_04090 [Halobacteriales archaeon SW_7_68_16]|nr:MAG: hypothetical protein BRD17_04090 [Halobacteriales archaeon SW_7_68_16]